MKCPSCAAAELIHDTRDITYSYKGETTQIPSVTADFCPACDESILDAEESRRTMQIKLAFNKQVNEAIALSKQRDEEAEALIAAKKCPGDYCLRLPAFVLCPPRHTTSSPGRRIPRLP